MLKVLRYRIYPTKTQRTKMSDTLELCRWTYNETLAIRKNAYEQEGKSISYYETKKLLPQWKDEKPELKSVHSQVLQEVVKRVDLAYHTAMKPRLQTWKDEKPLYSLRIDITDDMGSEGCSNCGT